MSDLQFSVQSFVFCALTFGPALLFARWRHNTQAEWPDFLAGQAAIVLCYLILLAFGFGAAMLAIPNAAKLYS